MQEKWRSIEGFTGLYEVSNLGRVRSINGRWGLGRMLKPGKSKGYNVVTLCAPGIRMTAQVATLVAKAFIGPNCAGLEICHNNGIRDDNRVQNLRYDTRKGNAADRLKHGTDFRGEKSPLARISAKQAQEILDDQGRYCDIAETFGISISHVRNIKAGATWRTLDRSRFAFKGKTRIGLELADKIRQETGSQSEIARKYGLNQSTVSKVKRGKTYKHLTD